MACGARIIGCAAAALMGVTALGQTVEFRVVERRGQATIIPGSSISTTDNVLDIGVQARVIDAGPGVGLRSFAFDIVVPCERDAFGTMATARISNGDGTYTIGTPSFGLSSTVGLGGLSAPMCGLAETIAGANGAINLTEGPVENNVSSQEIRHVRGLTRASWLLKVVDLDNNGVPDTSPLNGVGSAPDGATAALDAEIGQQYFGAEGTWVDVYHFRYTRTNPTLPCPYIIPFQVQPLEAPTLFSQMRRVSGAWEATSIAAAGQVATGLNFAACLGGAHCKADYDQNFALNVSDIFVFIADWFGGCIEIGATGCEQRSADFDCDGRLGVADIFAFLTVWFNGC